jgi:hypothetical protein
VNELIFTFIWSSPVHRVKKELLQKDFCEGGLKMINLNLFILALKTREIAIEISNEPLRWNVMAICALQEVK